MRLFDDFSMFVGRVVLWSVGVCAFCFFGYLLLCAFIGTLAWVFDRFFEGEFYIWKLIRKVLKKEQV